MCGGGGGGGGEAYQIACEIAYVMNGSNRSL